MGRINKSYLKQLAERKKFQSGGFSTEGYRRDSPDVDNPYNVIPSNYISMDDVDFPIYAVSNDGEEDILYPGEERIFSGDYVTEFPLKNMGNEKFGQTGFENFLKSQQSKNLNQRPAFLQQNVKPTTTCPKGFIFDSRAGKCVSESNYSFWRALNPETGVDPQKAIQQNQRYRTSYDYMQAYQNSPRYKEMLRNSAENEQDYLTLSEGRDKNLQTIPPLMLKAQPKESPGLGGESYDRTGQIILYPQSANNLDVPVHEISHSTDRPLDVSKSKERLMPKKDIDYIQKNKAQDIYSSRDYFNTNQYKQLSEDEFNKKASKFKSYYTDYIGDPSETRARLNAIRQLSKENNLYDPFTQKVNTDTYYKKLKNFNFRKTPDYDPMKQLQSIYSDEEIIYMLNNISKNESAQTEKYAQKGLENSSEQFLKNWVEKRKIRDAYIQEAYSMDQPEFVKRAQNFPPVVTVPNIDNNPNITGRYESSSGRVLRTPDAPPHVTTHEQTHYLQSFPSYMRTVHKDIVGNELKPVEQLSGDYKEKYDYFSNPDEVHSRIMVLREKAGFKPNKQVTEKNLNKFLKGYKGDVDNINDLLELSKDKKGLLNMLNYMAVKEKPTEYYGQKGFYKPDFRTKSQITNAQGQQRENTYVNPVVKNAAQLQRINQIQEQERQRRIKEAADRVQGTLRETNDADREAQNREDYTLLGRAQKLGRGDFNPLVVAAGAADMINPAALWYAGKDLVRGAQEVEKGISNLDLGQVGSGLLQTGLNALYLTPGVRAAGAPIVKNVAPLIKPVVKPVYNAVSSVVNSPKLNYLLEYKRLPKSLENIKKSPEASIEKIVNPKIDQVDQSARSYRFLEGLEKGAASLDESVAKRIKDLESAEGFKRLVAQEKEYLKSINYKGPVNTRAEINAQARINELKGYRNVNKEAGKYRKENIVTSNNEFVKDPDLYDNAYYNIPESNLTNMIVNDLYTPNLSSFNYGSSSQVPFVNIMKSPQLGSKVIPGEIGIGYNFIKNKPIEMHEIAHALQRRRILPFDKEIAKSITPKRYLTSGEKNSYKYFSKGSKKREPSAFLNELRESMQQKGFIPDYYSEIKPEQVQAAYNYFRKNPIGVFKPEAGLGKKFLSNTRIFDFMEPNQSNFQELSRLLNKAPAIVGAVGTGLGVGTLQQNQKPKGTYQGGGTILAEPDYDIYKAPKQGNYLLPDINRPYYTDEQGGKRSEYKMGFNLDGKETLLPTVVGGRQLTPEEAINRYYQTGLHMGQYNTPEEAEYASRLRTAKYNMLQDPARFNASMFQMGGTIGIPGVNGQVVSSGPQPLTSVKKTRGPISKDSKGDVKTMSNKQVKKILKNIK